MIEAYLERKGILAAKCVWTRICCCFWLIALPFRFVSESLNLTRIERIGRTMSMSAGKSPCLTGKSLTKAHFSMAMSTCRRYLIQFAIDSPVDSKSEWQIPTTCSLKVNDFIQTQDCRRALDLKNRKTVGKVKSATSIISIHKLPPCAALRSGQWFFWLYEYHGSVDSQYAQNPGHRMQLSNSDSAFSRSFKAFPRSMATLLAVQHCPTPFFPCE